MGQITNCRALKVNNQSENLQGKKNTSETCATICLSLLVTESELRAETQETGKHLHSNHVRKDKNMKIFKCMGVFLKYLISKAISECTEWNNINSSFCKKLLQVHSQDF